MKVQEAFEMVPAASGDLVQDVPSASHVARDGAAMHGCAELMGVSIMTRAEAEPLRKLDFEGYVVALCPPAHPESTPDIGLLLAVDPNGVVCLRASQQVPERSILIVVD